MFFSQHSTKGDGRPSRSEDRAFRGFIHFCGLFQRNSGEIIRNLEVQIVSALVPVDFHVMDINLNWNSSLLLGRAFMAIVGAVCDMQTNKVCLTLIDPTVYYDLVRVVRNQMGYMKIGDDPGCLLLRP